MQSLESLLNSNFKFVLVVEGEDRSEVHYFKSFASLSEHLLNEVDNYIDLDDVFGLDSLDITYRVLINR